MTHVAWPDWHSISFYRLSIQSSNRQLTLVRRLRYVLGVIGGEEKNRQPGAGPCFGSVVDIYLSLLMIACFMQMIVCVKNLLMFNQTVYCFVLPAYEIVRHVGDVLVIEFRIYVKRVNKNRIKWGIMDLVKM